MIPPSIYVYQQRLAERFSLKIFNNDDGFARTSGGKFNAGLCPR